MAGIARGARDLALDRILNDLTVDTALGQKSEKLHSPAPIQRKDKRLHLKMTGQFRRYPVGERTESLDVK